MLYYVKILQIPTEITWGNGIMDAGINIAGHSCAYNFDLAIDPVYFSSTLNFAWQCKI